MVVCLQPADEPQDSPDELKERLCAVAEHIQPRQYVKIRKKNDQPDIEGVRAQVREIFFAEPKPEDTPASLTREVHQTIALLLLAAYEKRAGLIRKDIQALINEIHPGYTGTREMMKEWMEKLDTTLLQIEKQFYQGDHKYTLTLQGNEEIPREHAVLTEEYSPLTQRERGYVRERFIVENESQAKTIIRECLKEALEAGQSCTVSYIYHKLAESGTRYTISRIKSILERVDTAHYKCVLAPDGERYQLIPLRRERREGEEPEYPPYDTRIAKNRIIDMSRHLETLCPDIDQEKLHRIVSAIDPADREAMSYVGIAKTSHATPQEVTQVFNAIRELTRKKPRLAGLQIFDHPNGTHIPLPTASYYPTPINYAEKGALYPLPLRQKSPEKYLKEGIEICLNYVSPEAENIARLLLHYTNLGYGLTLEMIQAEVPYPKNTIEKALRELKGKLSGDLTQITCSRGYYYLLDPHFNQTQKLKPWSPDTLNQSDRPRYTYKPIGAENAIEQYYEGEYTIVSPFDPRRIEKLAPGEVMVRREATRKEEPVRYMIVKFQELSPCK